MIVSCPSCTARFNVPDASLAGGPRRVKCGRCSHVWRVSPTVAAPEPPRPALRRVLEPAAAVAASGPSASAAASAGIGPSPLSPGVSAAAPQRRRSRGLWIGWLLLLVLVAGLAAAGWFARGWIVETWPPAEHAYDWLKVPLPRVEIVERTERETEEDGTRRLVVGGVLANHAERDLPVPPLVFTLYDAHGEPVNQWREAPPVAMLAAGESVEFTSTVGISTGDGAAQPRWEVALLRAEVAGEAVPTPPRPEDQAAGADSR